MTVVAAFGDARARAFWASLGIFAKAQFERARPLSRCVPRAPHSDSKIVEAGRLEAQAPARAAERIRGVVGHYYLIAQRSDKGIREQLAEMTAEGESLRHKDPDLTLLWRYVDFRCAGSSLQVRKSVRSAVANSVLDGYLPSAEFINDLVDFASGAISDEQHRARVLARAGVPDK